MPIYEAYGQTMQALNGLPTLQQRVGNRSWATTTMGSATGIWGRMEANRYRPDSLVSTSGSDLGVDSWKMQIGVDRTLSERSDGAMLVGGITAHYGNADGNVRSLFGDGSIDTKGYGVGATLTWYGPQGFYADGQAQLSWYDSKLESSIVGPLVDDNDGKGEAFSVEVGKRSPIGGKLSLTPQIQMVYSNVSFDSFTDPFGARVSADKGDSLKTRWGISLDHQNSWDNGNGTRSSHLYGLVNLTYEWLDGTRTDVSGTAIANANQRLWGEMAVGASLTISQKVTLYGEVGANTSIRDFGDSYSLKGNVGVRMQF